MWALNKKMLEFQEHEIKNIQEKNLLNNALSTLGGTNAETSPPFFDTSFTTVEFR